MTLIRNIEPAALTPDAAPEEPEQPRFPLTHLGRFVSLGILSATFAHEVLEPLTSILSNAEAALKLLIHNKSIPPEMMEILHDIVEEDLRAAQMIQRLQLLIAHPTIRDESVDLNRVIDDVLRLLHGYLGACNVIIEFEPVETASCVQVDSADLHQVIFHLLVNACEAMADRPPQERRLTVTTRFLPEHGSIQCSVIDRGGGIPLQHLEHIFEPYFTTKAHSLGLGLTMCRSIIRGQGGRLWAESTGDGAAFHFTAKVR